MINLTGLSGTLRNLFLERSNINEIEQLLLIISSKCLDYHWLLDNKEYILTNRTSDLYNEKGIVIIEDGSGSTMKWITIREFAKMLYKYDNEVKFKIEEFLLGEI
jgi:hypothetical protein